MNTSQLRKECPTQSNCDWKFHFITDGNFKNLSIYKCYTCGLLALHPRPNQTQLYNADYYEGKAEYSYVDERDQLRFYSYVWDERLKNIKKFIQTGSFLDIGSSFGGFLKRAALLGFDVYGVEISKYASQYANNVQNVPTFNGTIIEAKFPSNHFSVITMVEVIEHIENPYEFFSEIARILKPGGLLLIQTANFEGWQAKREGSRYHYFMPGHVYYYSHSILKNILTHFGFSRFFPYFGVDFSLLAKLKKSRGNFKSLRDYTGWFRIIYYHFKSKWKSEGFPLTSSYVLYAIKD